MRKKPEFSSFYLLAQADTKGNDKFNGKHVQITQIISVPV